MAADVRYFKDQRHLTVANANMEAKMVDEGKLHQFIGQMLSDLGGASSVAMVRIGDALGLYKALHAKGAMTVEELAAAVGANERYLREWLSHQAASKNRPWSSPRKTVQSTCWAAST
jgi:hypothetical protein